VCQVQNHFTTFWQQKINKQKYDAYERKRRTCACTNGREKQTKTAGTDNKSENKTKQIKTTISDMMDESAIRR
jgi:hypothetical protein